MLTSSNPFDAKTILDGIRRWVEIETPTEAPKQVNKLATMVADGYRDLAATITLERDPDDELDHAIDENERGLKDTIRVNPNEIVEIAVRFTTFSGRYMYHCHILEHEDRDMMRPFVTMAPELMPFMA